ncbi:uncharacterized protein LOC127432552 isoform X2 [Myxocyprinus asiaticus]|uniref:uncharacterized protein LOC127432552 isoform X2 n=1 Tax=Myxocyprinus asiaticus TaxID=70543 RepID=UPI002223D2A4|nr:uncharacterized protein LOC127432552 isoform X2 [Myxocyprinus asiaticus]
MSNPQCIEAYVAVSLTSMALLISVCLNVALYLLRRQERHKAANRDIFKCGEEPFRRVSIQSERFENNEMERQENPIYGNICLDGGGPFGMSEDVCYEQMSHASSAKQGLKVRQGDVSYASLDLTTNKKRRKKRKCKKQGQTHQAQTYSQPSAQQNCLDQDTEAEVTLPSRTSSLMVSRHSIYLNSHQVALEAEEREREWEREREKEKERQKDRDDNGEIEFEMSRHLHEGFEHTLGRLRPSLEQDS